MNPRRPLIAANWKMNLDATQATAWWNDFQPHLVQIRLLQLPPLPAEVVKQLRALHPYRSIVLIVRSPPVRVDLMIVDILHFNHRSQHVQLRFVDDRRFVHLIHVRS